MRRDIDVAVRSDFGASQDLQAFRIRYANMFRFSLVGFAASGAFLSRAYFDYFFCLIACVAVLKSITHQAWSQVEAHQDGDEETTSAGDSGQYAFPQPREAR
jgi:hypothetical protein